MTNVELQTASHLAPPCLLGPDPEETAISRLSCQRKCARTSLRYSVSIVGTARPAELTNRFAGKMPQLPLAANANERTSDPAGNASRTCRLSDLSNGKLADHPKVKASRPAL